MEEFNKSVFKELAEVHQPHCVSIYLPTHKAGPEGIKMDRITFKNQLKVATEKLRLFGLTKEQADQYLTPAKNLLENEHIWSHMSEGFMLFLYDDKVHYYRISISVTAQCHVDSHLYLLPAIPLLTDSTRHYIMTLSLNKIRLFEATRKSIHTINLPEEMPDGLLDVVGTDYEQSSLQFRSGQGESSDGAMYHGHGAGEMTEKKEEIAKYFQQVDDELMNLLNEEKVPLILACVDYLFPIYQEHNSYKHLESGFIKGNHDKTHSEELQQLAWEMIGDRYDKDRAKEIENYAEKLSAAAASFNSQEVIPAGMIGQAETLFVKNGAEIWGTYNPTTNAIDIDEFQRTGNAELINQAAIQTVQHGGKVLCFDEDEMPEEMGEIAAAFRYTL